MMCRNLNIKNVDNSVITSCLIKSDNNSNNFMRIKEKYNELHPNLAVVYNAECPFYRTQDEEFCPFFENISESM